MSVLVLVVVLANCSYGPKIDDYTYTICDSLAKERPEWTEDFELIETKDTTEKIVGLIKPITLIVLGGMIAWMGAAMLGPVYMNIANLGEMTNPREAY